MAFLPAHLCTRLAADAAAAAPKELTQEIVRLKGAAAAQKEATLLALCRCRGVGLGVELGKENLEGLGVVLQGA